MKKLSKSPKKQKSGGKKKYKVRNWKEYNQALVDRGSILFWINEEAIKNWEEQHKTGKRGKPRTFSNTAIETALTLAQVFHMPLRTTEGFLKSILQKLGSSTQIPDYSTLSIRSRNLPIQIRVRPIKHEPLHIVVDSTGIKIYGEGEWKVRMHGWSQHRTWRKLHIGIDERTGDILLGEVTGNDVTDSEIFGSLLNQLPLQQSINQISADGAYDRRVCYTALKERHIPHVSIPPQHNAKIWQHGNMQAERLARDENLRRIRKVGRKQWKVEQNYHRRSLAETCMFRLKTIFGERVSARTFATQRTQLLIRCKALNLMTTLGMPQNVLVG